MNNHPSRYPIQLLTTTHVSNLHSYPVISKRSWWPKTSQFESGPWSICFEPCGATSSTCASTLTMSGFVAKSTKFYWNPTNSWNLNFHPWNHQEKTVQRVQKIFWSSRFAAAPSSQDKSGHHPSAGSVWETIMAMFGVPHSDHYVEYIWIYSI
jgi:hypothetical protein